MPNKTIFKNTDRVKKAGIPQGKPAEYKISKTVITGEPVNKANFKPKPVIQKPTIGEIAKRGLKNTRNTVSSVIKGAKQVPSSATTTVMRGAEKFKGVFDLDKKYSRGGKVHK